jgi:hypothetical protein
MIVAGPEGFLKSQYRKFNIKSEAGANSDDFGMMKEVLTRRFERLLKEDPDRKTDMWPDLLLIDGGAGQVSAVAEIMSELGVEDIAMVGVAKGIDRDAGKEEFHRPNERPFALQRNDPVLYFIQRLRDEAHRWAIGAHRAKRAKAVSLTPAGRHPRHRSHPQTRPPAALRQRQGRRPRRARRSAGGGRNLRSDGQDDCGLTSRPKADLKSPHSAHSSLPKYPRRRL